MLAVATEAPIAGIVANRLHHDPDADCVDGMSRIRPRSASGA